VLVVGLTTYAMERVIRLPAGRNWRHRLVPLAVSSIGIGVGAASTLRSRSALADDLFTWSLWGLHGSVIIAGVSAAIAALLISWWARWWIAATLSGAVLLWYGSFAWITRDWQPTANKKSGLIHYAPWWPLRSMFVAWLIAVTITPWVFENLPAKWLRRTPKPRVVPLVGEPGR
jgi:ABC-type branched-subunit amino acid transport system permease subunit